MPRGEAPLVGDYHKGLGDAQWRDSEGIPRDITKMHEAHLHSALAKALREPEKHGSRAKGLRKELARRARLEGDQG